MHKYTLVFLVTCTGAVIGYFHYSLNAIETRLTAIEQKATSPNNLSNTIKQPDRSATPDPGAISTINYRIEALENELISLEHISSSLQQSLTNLSEETIPNNYQQHNATTTPGTDTEAEQVSSWETLSQRFDSSPLDADYNQRMNSVAEHAINSIESNSPILIEDIACRSQGCRIKLKYTGDQENNDEMQIIEDEILVALSQTGLNNGTIRNDGSGGYEAILFQAPPEGEIRDTKKR